MANSIAAPQKGSVTDEHGMSFKHKILSVLTTALFAILGFTVVFPVFAGLLASFRPGTELIRRGLSVNLDVTTMTLNNYKYLLSGNVDSVKYFNWFKKVHDYSFGHFSDNDLGEWYGYLHRDNTVSHTQKGSMWKGPYHYPRMLMLIDRISGLLAAGKPMETLL